MRDKISKLLPLDNLQILRNVFKTDGRTVVWTNGCFDLLHVGHVQSLRAARQLGDVLIVGLNSDSSVRHLKGPNRPIFSSQERAEMLAALEFVDYIVVFEETTPFSVISCLQPDICCKGSDYAPPNGQPMPEEGLITSYGGRIVFLPYIESISTSILIQKLQWTS